MQGTPEVRATPGRARLADLVERLLTISGTTATALTTFSSGPDARFPAAETEGQVAGLLETPELPVTQGRLEHLLPQYVEPFPVAQLEMAEQVALRGQTVLLVMPAQTSFVITAGLREATTTTLLGVAEVAPGMAAEAAEMAATRLPAVFLVVAVPVEVALEFVTMELQGGLVLGTIHPQLGVRPVAVLEETPGISTTAVAKGIPGLQQT